MNNRGIIQFVTLNVVVALLLAGLIAFDGGFILFMVVMISCFIFS